MVRVIDVSTVQFNDGDDEQGQCHTSSRSSRDWDRNQAEELTCGKLNV